MLTQILSFLFHTIETVVIIPLIVYFVPAELINQLRSVVVNSGILDQMFMLKKQKKQQKANQNKPNKMRSFVLRKEDESVIGLYCGK